jgi:hypothetical protein
MAKGYLVKVDHEGTITRTRIDRVTGPTVKEIQDQLGGYFAQIGVLFEGSQRTAYIDEDAKLPKRGKPLPPVNPYATRMVQEYYADRGKTVDILGNIVIWIPDEGRVPKPQPLRPRDLQGGGDGVPG